jgi:hypothetical protein
MKSKTCSDARRYPFSRSKAGQRLLENLAGVKPTAKVIDLSQRKAYV